MDESKFSPRAKSKINKTNMRDEKIIVLSPVIVKGSKPPKVDLRSPDEKLGKWKDDPAEVKAAKKANGPRKDT